MPARLTNRTKRLTILLWALDMLVVVASLLVSARLRFIGNPLGHLIFLRNALPREILVAVLITVSMACFGLYQAYVRHNRWDLLLRLFASSAFAAIGVVVAYYLLPQMYIGRGVMALGLLIAFFGVLGLRLLARNFFTSEVLRRRILVLGAGAHANMINSEMRRRLDRQSFTLVGFIALPGQPSLVPDKLLVRADQGLAELASRLQVHEIVVAPDERRGGLPMEEMLQCAQLGIAVTDLSTFFEREAGFVKLGIVDPSWLVFSGGFDHSLPRLISKRMFDLLAASALLLVAWPFMLAVAVGIWFESGGPVLYWQARVGQGGRPFNLVKFRSMRVDAEQDGQARWASLNDDRSTRFGRFIRKTRLDELPQLFNVLRGHMSFVGPRPERPQFVGMLNDEIRFYHVRHCVKPGLTGWAQLRYPYGASVHDAEEKLKFDLFYVKNQGFLFDFMILLQTVEVVLFGRGAR